jgi:hypothetical protein
LTYPRGILIYNLKENNFKKIPLKFPLFPDRAKTKTVCAVSGIRKEYLENTIKKSLSLKKDGIISDKMYEILINLLQQDYMDPFVLQQETYSNQAVILNFKLWKKILKGKLEEYKVVYLELEEITSKIIEKDLSNQNSLINITLFDPIVRERLINSLDCKKACWENNMLRQKCLNDIPKKNEFSKIGNCGTHFFWGIDKNQKRISFFLNNDGSKNLLLVGFDENNNLIKIPFQPDILREKLLKKEIIPSIFLSYLAISFARGIICVGGYYQSEYLPVMKDKLIESLNSQKSYKQIISAITNIETKNYLSGMQTIMIMNDDYSIVPAGPVELIASDGINDEDINKIEKINIIDAHKASMIDTLTDLKMENNVNEDWKEIVSRQNYMQLRENLIIRQKI